MTQKLHPVHLLLTTRGEQWLTNFETGDRYFARELVDALDLVSVAAFERGISKVVRRVSDQSQGAVALYGAREVEGKMSFEEGTRSDESGLDATPRGSQIGSEGRVAHILRNIAREDSQKFLLHPSIEVLRRDRVSTAVIVDDLIGSGDRTTEYIDALYAHPSVRSWVSSKHLKIVVCAYAVTAIGERKILEHSSKPTVVSHRHCPTLATLPWKASRIELLRNFCKKYADRAKIPWPVAEGYGYTGSLLVFEHGCPDNVPGILWHAPGDGIVNWTPLFKEKSIGASLHDVFPVEIGRRDPVSSLISAGQQRIAASYRQILHRPLSAEVIVLLSLVAAGKRRVETFAAATGLPARDCVLLREDCISEGLITPLFRITERGRAELRGMQIHGQSDAGKKMIPDHGADEYYPTSLRAHVSS